MRREEREVGIKRAIPFYSPAECAILCEYELGSGGEGRKVGQGQRGGRREEGKICRARKFCFLFGECGLCNAVPIRIKEQHPIDHEIHIGECQLIL